MSASARDVDLCVVGPWPAEEVPGPTSGKFCLKAAYSSSPGFCEERLLLNMAVSLEAVAF